MVNILLNNPAISAKWCKRRLSRYIRHGKKVLIVPFSYHEDYLPDEEAWERYFSPGGEQYEQLVPPLLEMGVKLRDIAFVNYFTDTPKTMGKLIHHADVIYFTGGWPDKMMDRLWEFGCISQLSNFHGTVMGFSAGAMIQFDFFHITPEEEDQSFKYYEGLDMIEGFDIEVHFHGSDVQKECINQTIRDTGRPVFAMEENGGLIIDGDQFTPIGKVHFYHQPIK